MDRQKWLLLVVAILVFLKVITGPLFEHMDALQISIEQHERRVLRSSKLVELEPKLTTVNEQLTETLISLESQFPQVEDPAFARLTIQTKIQSLARDNKITISSLEWDTVRPGTPEQAYLTIAFEGRFKDFVSYQLALEQQVSGLNIGEMVFKVDKQRLRSKTSSNRLGTIKGDLIVEVSYLVAEAQA
jgi:hypothetical protein